MWSLWMCDGCINVEHGSICHHTMVEIWFWMHARHMDFTISSEFIECSALVFAKVLWSACLSWVSLFVCWCCPGDVSVYCFQHAVTKIMWSVILEEARRQHIVKLWYTFIIGFNFNFGFAYYHTECFIYWPDTLQILVVLSDSCNLLTSHDLSLVWIPHPSVKFSEKSHLFEELENLL